MADQKPTRTAADERSTLQALLRYCRDSFVRKLDGVDDATPAGSCSRPPPRSSG